MSRLEVMAMLLSIKALIESQNTDKALEVIGEVLEEARTIPKKKPKESE